MPDVDDITGNNDNQKLTGTAQGYGGEVRVNVEVNGDDIVSVEAIGDEESEGVGSKAIEELPGKNLRQTKYSTPQKFNFQMSILFTLFYYN